MSTADASSTASSNGHPHPLSECEAVEDFLSILQSLVREPSVVGAEDSFFRVLRRELEEVGVKISYYQGVLVAEGNNPDHLILSAHVDRHGLMCTGPNEFQYAAFISSNRSELTGDSVSEQMIGNLQGRFNGQRLQAHLPYVGTYIGQGQVTKSFLSPDGGNMVFKVDGLEFVQPGSPISFLDRLIIEDGRISAQLDNVLSVALLVHLFRSGFQGTGLFTAQEEAGRSWRFALSYFQRRDIASNRLVVLDTSPFPDAEAAEQQQLVLRRKDATASFAPELTEEIRERCDELGISTIFKDEYVEQLNLEREKPLSLGRTELGRLVAATEGEINGTTLQIPTFGYHTAHETASLSSIEAMLKLLSGYVS
ncbi:peptidase M42 [Calycomorphotria hydatis]|uniref:M42 glutamyl aminopeptidase n=1 Tax=Calycomorphotria hydatis TaxID=2528027 RepID=A0A517TDJ3_9PLAN|nr:peptidase M42 [Calycomorphotria hydatis]QDT66450.1 M42 glutamyl aminopeptidase [Calycomorphotria hydatis]